MKDPYKIVHYRYITEKTRMLEQLKEKNSNPSLARCSSPKYVFVVNTTATKPEIASAIEEIYKENSVTVKDVNTITIKPKKKNRRRQGREGKSAYLKKAIVTLATGDSIDSE